MFQVVWQDFKGFRESRRDVLPEIIKEAFDDKVAADARKELLKSQGATACVVPVKAARAKKPADMFGSAPAVRPPSKSLFEISDDYIARMYEDQCQIVTQSNPEAKFVRWAQLPTQRRAWIRSEIVTNRRRMSTVVADLAKAKQP